MRFLDKVRPAVAQDEKKTFFLSSPQIKNTQSAKRCDCLSGGGTTASSNGWREKNRGEKKKKKEGKGQK